MRVDVDRAEIEGRPDFYLKEIDNVSALQSWHGNQDPSRQLPYLIRMSWMISARDGGDTRGARGDQEKWE